MAAGLKNGTMALVGVGLLFPKRPPEFEGRFRSFVQAVRSYAGSNQTGL
jgi:hypothetical protein